MDSKATIEILEEAKPYGYRNRTNAVRALNENGQDIHAANEALHVVNIQLREITERAAELQKIANFTIQHPEPMVRINDNGIVLFQNAAATGLKEFYYNGHHFDADHWWKYLVSIIDRNSGETIIETINDNLRFSFKCYYNPAEKTYDICGRKLQYVPVESQTTKPCFFDFLNNAGRFSALIENLQDGILIEDENRKLLLTNHRFCEIFGLAEKPSMLTGIDCWKLTKRAMRLFIDPVGFLNSTQELVNNQQHTSKKELLLKDGRIFKQDFIPIKNNEGAYLGNMWVFNDITTSFTGKKALEGQRFFYENILNSLPADVAVFDTDGRYRFINPVSLDSPKLRKWIIGKTDEEYCAFRNLPIETSLQRKQYFEEVIKSKKEIRWEEERFDANGKQTVHLRILYPATDEAGNILQVMGYGIDITERKLFEQQIKLSEKRYRELIHFSQGIIITHDLDGLIKSINPAVEKILGFPAEHVIGRNLISFLPEEDRPDFHLFYLSNLEHEGSVEGVLRIFNIEGKRTFLLYKNVVVNEPGTDPYVIGFAQDITERILAEKELEVAKQASEDGSRAKERFLANMSHEIRTPMSGIIGIANLLKKTDLNTQQENYLNLVLESANNLIVIINDILDLEKIIAGKLEFETIPFNINEKVQIAAESFRYKAEEKDIRLTITNKLPKNLHVSGDPYRLSQILTNIISNAVKFTELGRISVSIDMKEVDNDHVNITYRISDTGIGISPNKLNAIFDPYVQERSEISRKYGGTGLGLAICKNLVDLQGGKMEVKSQPGKGSSFIITIPYKKAISPAAVADDSLDLKLLAGKKILVAEDVEINQFLVNHILESWGCMVTIAPNGEEAIRQLNNNDFDAILMDIQMPVLDGIESTQQIRLLKNKAKSGIPIIALTANALKGDDDKYIAAGMNGYLTKPFNEIALYSILAQVLKMANPLRKDPELAVSSTKVENTFEMQQLYDLTKLKAMSGNDPSFLPMMAKLFIDTAPATLQKMSEALNEKDWKMIGTMAHKLKPTIDTMNIVSLKELIRTAEQHGKQEMETDRLGEKVKQIVSTLNCCIDTLKIEFSL